MTKKLSIGSWAYIFNQEKPTNDFHVILHKLAGPRLRRRRAGQLRPAPGPDTCDTRQAAEAQERMSPITAWRSPASPSICGASRSSGAVDRRAAPFIAAFPRTSSSPTTSASRPSASIPSSRLTSSKERRASIRRLVFDRVRQGVRQVQQDGGRPRHEHLLGIRAGLPVQQAVGDRRPGRCGARRWAIPTSASCTTPATPTCARSSAPTRPATKETLPGGELELLQKLKGKITHVHLIDSDGSLNEHNTSTHNPFGTGKLNFDKLMPALLTMRRAERLVVRRSVLLAERLGRDGRLQTIPRQAAEEVRGVSKAEAEIKTRSQLGSNPGVIP